MNNKNWIIGKNAATILFVIDATLYLTEKRSIQGPIRMYLIRLIEDLKSGKTSREEYMSIKQWLKLSQKNTGL